MFRAHLNVDQVEGLAADPDVLFIQPRQEGERFSGQGGPCRNLVAPHRPGQPQLGKADVDASRPSAGARARFHIDGTGPQDRRVFGRESAVRKPRGQSDPRRPRALVDP